MNKYNIYKSKFRTLEFFYLWVEQGSPYNIAVEQCLANSRPQNKLDDIVTDIIIATRFARSDKPLSPKFKRELGQKIQEFADLDLSAYELTDQELKELRGEVNEVDLYIKSNRA